MPCAGPDYSCNSLISIRSPLGEIRLGPPGSAKPAARPLWPLIRTYRASREMLAHRRQRQALLRLDRRLLDDVGLMEADAHREARKWAVEMATTAIFAGSSLRPLARFWRAFLAASERFTRQRLKYAARELNTGLLDRIAASDPEVAREIRKLFGL